MKKTVRNYAILACLSAGLAVGAAGVSSVAAGASSLVSTDMTMTLGASLYLEEVSGLKFQYTIANYDEAADKNYGMVIVPYDYLAKAGITDLTANTNDYVTALKGATLPNEPIIVENLEPNADGEVEFSVGDLNTNNYAREFFGIGFEKTGENSYLYATQNDNVRSVFEVANLALNKLNYGTWDLNEAEQAAEKELLASKETSVLNPFITTAFEFVYGTSTPTLTVAASAVSGEVTPVVSATKVKDVELAMHWNYASEDEDIAQVADGKIKGASRGQSKITASLGKALSVEATAAVLKDEAELSMYNNSHKADFFAEEGKISLQGGYYKESKANTEKNSSGAATPSSSVGYVAFEDTYTLDENGTYVDMYFTGNNMPLVEFFASDVEELFMHTDWKTDYWGNATEGFIVSNGLATSRPTDNMRYRKQDDHTYTYSQYSGYFGFGVSPYADRWNGAEGWALGAQAATDGSVTVYDNTNSKDSVMKYSNFSMYAMEHINSATQNYRYTVGMYKDADGYVYIDASLYKVNGTTETLWAYWQDNVRIDGRVDDTEYVEQLTEGESISGKIVIHAAVKGTDADYKPLPNVFSCSVPYAGDASTRYKVAEETAFNADGTVSVTNGAVKNTNDITKLGTSGYLVLDDDYELGEYVDIYFTGNNMPNLSFLTKTVEQLNTNTAGFLIWRGSKDASTYMWQTAGSFLVYSPARTGSNQDKGDMNGKSLGSTTSNATSAQTLAHPLSMYVLETYEATTQFKMTVGFYENADGYIEMSVEVDTWDETNGAWVDYVAKGGKTTAAHSSFTMTSTLDAENDTDKIGKYLIAYGMHVGSSTSTTFRYSAPYTKA